MNKYFFVTLVGIPLAWAQSTPLSYRLQIDPLKDPHGIRISGTVSTQETATTDFRVLINYGSGKSLRLVENLSFTDPKGTILQSESIKPGLWRVQHQPQEEIYFSYRLRTDPSAHGLSMEMPGGGEMPYMDENLFFTFGYLSFVRPLTSQTGPVMIEWDVPRGWKVATPWPMIGPQATIPVLTDLLLNYVAAGHYVRTSRKLNNFEFEVVWFGKERFHSKTTDQFAKTFETANRLFGEVPTRKYLLIFKPIARMGHMEASPKFDSMQFNVPKQSSPKDLLSPKNRPELLRMLTVLAHEYTHTWGRKRPKPEKLEDNEEPEAGGELRWFKEGFTDYFARLVLFQAGIMNAEEFATAMHEAYLGLKSHSAYGKTSLIEASQQFFESDDMRRFSYLGGSLLALKLDWDLRNSKSEQPSRTLAAFMKNYFGERHKSSQDDPSLDELLGIWKKFGGDSYDLNQAVKTPFQFDFYGLLASAGVQAVGEKKSYSYDAAVEIESGQLKATLVGPMARAQGLRQNDIILKVEGSAIKQAREFYKRLSGEPKPVEIKRGPDTLVLNLYLLESTKKKLRIDKRRAFSRLKTIS